MTRNQILYQEQVERARSNRANEMMTTLRDQETARSNRAREHETARSNVARETETHRANLANEFLRNSELSEASRSHIANEAIQSSHYNRLDAETARSNLARELETNRTNMAKEAEENRSNLARELESNRHNVQQEQQNATDTVLRYDTATSDRQSREQIAAQQVASQQLIERMRQQGYNQRQATQIAADAIKVLHDDIARVVSSGQGQRFVRNLADRYYINQIEKGR